MQENAARWHFESVTRAPRSFTKFRISAGGHLVFSKGVHLWFWVKIWNLPRVCLWLLWTRKFQSGERVIKTIYEDFKLGFFRRVMCFWLLFIIEPKSCPVIVWTATAREWSKQFTHIEHRAGAVSSGWPERVSVFCAYSSISVSSSPLFYLFTSATVRIAVHTTLKSDTEPVRYVTLFTKIQDHADQKSG